MTRGRLVVIAPALLLSLALAYLLRDAIRRLVILPLSYFWWIASLYYHFIPQIWLWILLVAVILYMGIYDLVSGIRIVRRLKPESKNVRGPLADLAVTLQKAQQGTYFKWLVAHRLGRLARQLLAQREARRGGKGGGPLHGRDWSPPEALAAYLETGLNGSFADFPRPRWPLAGERPTPLDLDPAEAVGYLEAQMETSRDRDP